MINCVTCETAHFFGDALASQYRLRYQAFVNGQNWDLSQWRGMEYDIYDTPAATYFVWQDEQQKVRGTSRLLPTDRPYMLQDLWPESIQSIALPNSINIWEGSRFCVDDNLPKSTRKRIIQEIVCAYLEYGLSHSIEHIIGIMPPAIWESVFIRNGWKVDFLGTKERYGGGRTNIAGKMSITPQTLLSVRQATGIQHPVLIQSPFNLPKDYCQENVA